MIQRIQTIWLFLITVCSIIPIFISFHPLLWNFGNGLIATVSIFTIFLYKKRRLQLKVCYGMFILLLILNIPVFISPKWIMALSIISMGGNTLAIRAIRKDEKLVHSSDRLRK